MFKWVQGRQDTGYYKMVLMLSKKLSFDCYLLKFEEGVEVPWHYDPVKSGKKHYRLNVYLRKGNGGQLVIDGGKPIVATRLFHLFRPDVQRHRMTRVEGRTQYMLSLGWLN